MNIDRLDWIEILSRCDVPEERRAVEKKLEEERTKVPEVIYQRLKFGDLD